MRHICGPMLSSPTGVTCVWARSWPWGGLRRPDAVGLVVVRPAAYAALSWAQKARAADSWSRSWSSIQRRWARIPRFGLARPGLAFAALTLARLLWLVRLPDVPSY
jgi:hypothetical protein